MLNFFVATGGTLEIYYEEIAIDGSINKIIIDDADLPDPAPFRADAGSATQLSDNVVDPVTKEVVDPVTANSDLVNLCQATTQDSLPIFGTPGLSNEPCPSVILLSR